jgi:hypothetical protein
VIVQVGNTACFLTLVSGEENVQAKYELGRH